MRLSNPPLPVRRCLLALSLVVSVGTIAACGGNASPAAGDSPTPAATATPSAPTSSPSASSTPSVKSQAPVPAEKNPPGDIPDNLAFVKYTNRPGHYAFTHPEGWAQTGSGSRVRFTDKLNGVAVDSLNANQAPTVSTARSNDVPRLKGSVPAFELRDVGPVNLPAGQGVRIIFRRNSDPDAVTGKVYRDEVEEYLVYHAGRLIRMDLYGPVGADNVDAYRTMSQSLSIR